MRKPKGKSISKMVVWQRVAWQRCWHLTCQPLLEPIRCLPCANVCVRSCARAHECRAYAFYEKWLIGNITFLLLPRSVTRTVFAQPKSIQATVTLLENLHVILEKTPRDDIRSEVLPLLFNSFESTTIQVQVGVFLLYNSLRFSFVWSVLRSRLVFALPLPLHSSFIPFSIFLFHLFHFLRIFFLSLPYWVFRLPQWLSKRVIVLFTDDFFFVRLPFCSIKDVFVGKTYCSLLYSVRTLRLVTHSEIYFNERTIVSLLLYQMTVRYGLLWIIVYSTLSEWTLCMMITTSDVLLHMLSLHLNQIVTTMVNKE